MTVQVESQAPQLQELLARDLTPMRLQVEGVKSIPFDEVAQRFTPLVGKDTTVGDLIEVANGVTRLDQERGYALSFGFIPAQSIDDGVVRVTVVEGYVSAVKVTGKAGPVEERIRSIAAHIVADRPLRRATFERYINVLGLLPGIKVAANVAPPQNTRQRHHTRTERAAQTVRFQCRRQLQSARRAGAAERNRKRLDLARRATERVGVAAQGPRQRHVSCRACGGSD